MESNKFFTPNLQNIENGNYLVFDPAWETKILDWFQREDIERSQKEALIEDLISFEDRCGGFYSYRAYFLAARYIEVFPDSKFADEIVTQLLKWSFDFFAREENNIARHFQLQREVKQALKYTDISRVVSKIEKFIETTQDINTLLAASQELIKLDSRNQIAITTIKNILLSVEDENIIFKQLHFLFDRSLLTQDYAVVLVKSIDRVQSGHSIDFEVWISNTFYYLNSTTIGNTQVIEALIRLIKRLPIPYQYEDEYLCAEALKTLGRIGENSDRTTKAIEELLQNDLPDNLVLIAAKALWHIDSENSLSIDLCLQLLETTNNSYVIRDTVLFLLREELNESAFQKPFIEIAIEKLIYYISQDTWVETCRQVITVLEAKSKSHPTALQGLFYLLEIVKDDGISLAIARSLLKLNPKNKKALAIFENTLQTTKDDWKSYNLAKALLTIDPQNKKASDTFEKLLITSKDTYSRLEIAKKIIETDPSNQKAIETLCELIYMPRLHSCLDPEDLALPVLERLDPSKKLAIKAIEDYCQKTTNQDALIYFIPHLNRLDPQNDIAQKKLDRIIAVLIDSMKTYDPEDDISLFNVAIYGRGIKKSNLLPEVVIALKPYLKTKSSENYENYDIAIGIIWDCAKSMKYIDFHRVWRDRDYASRFD